MDNINLYTSLYEIKPEESKSELDWYRKIFKRFIDPSFDFSVDYIYNGKRPQVTISIKKLGIVKLQFLRNVNKTIMGNITDFEDIKTIINVINNRILSYKMENMCND